MNEPAKKIATYDDLCGLPDTMVGEIIDGEVIASPRPSRSHGHTASILGGEIVPPYFAGRGGPGGWIIIDEPEIAFGDDIIVPDLAGWKKERFPAIEEHNWIEVIPDWVCEIVSPSSSRMDRVKKMGIYARHGCPYYWIIDPSGKTLEVFENNQGTWMVIGSYGGDDLVRALPFKEIAIDLRLLWLENALK